MSRIRNNKHYQPHDSETVTDNGATSQLGAGFQISASKPREEDPGSEEPGVRMGTMKRIKGLEFRAVALACADPRDPMNRIRAADIRDRCERYVAVTRAREHVLIVVSAH